MRQTISIEIKILFCFRLCSVYRRSYLFPVKAGNRGEPAGEAGVCCVLCGRHRLPRVFLRFSHCALSLSERRQAVQQVSETLQPWIFRLSEENEESERIMRQLAIVRDISAARELTCTCGSYCIVHPDRLCINT